MQCTILHRTATVHLPAWCTVAHLTALRRCSVGPVMRLRRPPPLTCHCSFVARISRIESRTKGSWGRGLQGGAASFGGAGPCWAGLGEADIPGLLEVLSPRAGHCEGCFSTWRRCQDWLGTWPGTWPAYGPGAPVVSHSTALSALTNTWCCAPWTEAGLGSPPRVWLHLGLRGSDKPLCQAYLGDPKGAAPVPGLIPAITGPTSPGAFQFPGRP